MTPSLLRLPLVGGLAVLVLAGCGGMFGPLDVVRGSGTVRTESRQVSGIDQVSFATVGTLTIAQGSSEALTVEAEDNLLPLIRTDVSGGRLDIGVERGKGIAPTRPVRYQLTVKRLGAVEVTGSGSVHAPALDADRLSLDISGSGDMTVDRMTAQSLTVEISGSGHLTASGQVPAQNVSISGSGDYKGAGLDSREATAEVTGSGNCAMRVSDRLDATVSGSGSVRYTGSPTVQRHITGSGTVSRA